MGYMKDIYFSIQNGGDLNSDEVKVAEDAGYEVEEVDGMFYVKEKE
jgi:hypothetical protein